MSTLTLEPPTAVLPAVTPLFVPHYHTCDFQPCGRPAVLAVAFRGLKLEYHSHVCKEHVRETREFYDIVASVPAPCPWPHIAPENVRSWSLAPKLEG